MLQEPRRAPWNDQESVLTLLGGAAFSGPQAQPRPIFTESAKVLLLRLVLATKDEHGGYDTNVKTLPAPWGHSHAGPAPQRPSGHRGPLPKDQGAVQLGLLAAREGVEQARRGSEARRDTGRAGRQRQPQLARGMCFSFSTLSLLLCRVRTSNGPPGFTSSGVTAPERLWLLLSLTGRVDRGQEEEPASSPS